MVGFMPLLIFVASFHNSASVWKVRRIDYACGAMSVVGTVVWLVTRNGVLAISAAIAADFLAGVPTLMKSWTHPETETVHSYVGAVDQHGASSCSPSTTGPSTWWPSRSSSPCTATRPVVLVGLEPGPRLRRARRTRQRRVGAVDRAQGMAPLRPRRLVGKRA